MKTAHVPSVAGIYVIRNTTNGKVYIGSSTNARYRLNAHRSQLRRGVHFSPHLSAAWAKYGEAAFTCGALEIVADPADLVAREQHWIDTLDAVAKGYNISAVAGSNLGLVHSAAWVEKVAATKRKRFPGFVSPEGIPQSIINLPAFCESNGLHHAGMSALATGRIATHKGWTHANGKQIDRRVLGDVIGLTDPAGNELDPVKDFRAFCAGRGLDYLRMREMVRGRKVSCHGYTIKGGRARKPRAKNYVIKTVVGFYNPAGEPVTITNLVKFCRENRLDHRRMMRLRAGECGSHHGWRYGLSGCPEHRQPGPKPRTLTAA